MLMDFGITTILLIAIEDISVPQVKMKSFNKFICHIFMKQKANVYCMSCNCIELIKNVFAIFLMRTQFNILLVVNSGLFFPSNSFRYRCMQVIVIQTEHVDPQCVVVQKIFQFVIFLLHIKFDAICLFLYKKVGYRGYLLIAKKTRQQL